MTSAAPLTLGGRYQLVERLAVGGMGEVWKGHDDILGRDIAVKILREEHAHDPTFRQRFRAEAQHAAMLVHPNIAQVFDFGDGDDAAGDPPYLVMELIRGEPLSTVIERDAPLSAERTWSILGQAASALSAAHAAGIVHRDVKPGNLLLCPDGQLKVTDFGIARATGASSVTTVGTLLGTPHYISPEQVAGEAVSAASDFYALGAVGYECLTGRRLYDGDAMAVLLAHRERPAPPLPSYVPAGLRELVTAMLDKDPAKRPIDGRAIAAQAERFAAATTSMPLATEAYPVEPRPSSGAAPPTGVLETPAAAVAPPRHSGRRMQAAVAVVVALAVVAAAVVLATRGSGGRSAADGRKTAALTPVHVSAVSPYDGSAGSGDHPEEAALAADGKAGTAWYTQHYATASFGSLRSGTGLMFDLGRAVDVKTLKLRLAVPGVAVTVHAAAAPASLLSAPTVGSSPSAGTTLVLHPKVTARYWLVWFTKLAPNDGGYRAGVAEASFAH